MVAGECDDIEGVARGLFVARGDPPELLELGKAAFDQVAFFGELPVKRVLCGA